MNQAMLLSRIEIIVYLIFNSCRKIYREMLLYDFLNNYVTIKLTNGKILINNKTTIFLVIKVS